MEPESDERMMDALLKKESRIKELISDSEYKQHSNTIWHLLKHIVSFNVLGKRIPVNRKNMPVSIYRQINDVNFHNFLCQLINILNPVEYTYEINKTSKILYNTDNVSNLKNDGVIIYPNVLNEMDSTSIINSVNNKRFTQSNNNINNFDLYDPMNKGVWWFADNHIELYHNHIVQSLLTDENLLRMIHSYFDTTPILHGLNFWATYPGERDSTHNFHQDWDDMKLLKVFVYLNDVNSDNGPHFYIKNSLHKIIKKNILPRGHSGGRRIDDNFFSNYKDDIMEITGNTGTLIIEDTKGFHKGSVVKTGKRYIFQILFGVSRAYDLLEYKKEFKFQLNKDKSNKMYQAKQKYPFIYQRFTFQ